MSDEIVKQGDFVQVNYVGKFENGEIFDQSKDQPLDFIAGTHMVVKGFDDAVIGMKKGETKKVDLKPEDAYGHPNPQLVQEIPKTAFGDKADQLKEGVTIGLQNPAMPGRMMPAVVKQIIEDKIILDMNHPLSGKSLHFEISVVDFREATEEDKKKFMPPQPAAPEEPKVEPTEEPKEEPVVEAKEPVVESKEEPKVEPTEEPVEESACSGDCSHCQGQ